MSADSGSSVFDIDSPPSPAEDDFKPADSVSGSTVKGKHSPKVSECNKRISAVKDAHRKQIQDLKSKYQSEYKALREEMKAQSKKSGVAIKEAGEASKRLYEGELKQLRAEFGRQNALLRTELTKYLRDSVDEITKSYESKLLKDNDDRLESLKAMIHEDFVEAIEKKNSEIDQLRSQSEAQISEVIQENKEKTHRVSQLESRMKEICQYLPDDVQAEVYEQFSFEDELAALEEDPKPKRKGLLGKLTSAL